jgi:hypothetical protein
MQKLLQQLWKYASPYLNKSLEYITPYIKRLWSFIAEILIDPIFYGYTVVAVYDKMQTLNEYAKNFPQYGFWRILDADMNTEPNFWLVFFTILTIWILAKAWIHDEDSTYKKGVLNSLKNIEKKLGYSKESDIGSINKKINEALKRIKGKSGERRE